MTGKDTKSPDSGESGLLKKVGGVLLSHTNAVPSALAGLTSLFGMGRGGTPPLKPPEAHALLKGII
jgi:hypothetical protein